ncbi:MAG: 6,7-dimethyl-8-ribityllumazine synthase [Saprospiraceae bacterium]|nr:6,7-dimethyl-8-ribityllumazine synthase [Saprospiraceae bacterium]
MATEGHHLSEFDKSKLRGAEKLNIGIVTSEWNEEVCQDLSKGAHEALGQLDIPKDQVIEVNVPGAFELPAGAAMLLKSKKLDAVICLGCVIKGETRHDEYINHSVAIGINQISVVTGKPVIYGVLTTENVEQAKARSGGKHGNKGVEAAISAVKMALLSKSLYSSEKHIGF